MTTVRWSHLVVVLSVAIVLQTGLFDQIWLFDRLRIDVMVLLVVAVGLRADARTSSVLGFIIGIVVDLFRFSPFGFHALVYCLAGWVVANTRLRMLQAGATFRTAQGGLTVALVTAFTWLGGAVFDLGAPPFGNRMLGELGLIAITGAVLIHPVGRIAAWTIRAPRPGGVPSATMVRVE